ncbi:hypothetical protein GCM10010250_09110 [Streptomyces althioticus]|uniref:hemerythrin domain-containing protein n=1 Tax=Streptomyces althioticus TaxID=83380 RepID=UPI0019C7E69B|nr:hypothetical protein GCM10010250_09110 [Streptomyces althioticus]
MTAPAVSISEQDADALGGDDSILMRQRRDHARLDAMMNRWLSEDLPPGELDALWLDIVQLVFSHAFAEETVLWPLLRRVSPDGEELTRQVEEEHQAINDLVARIESSPDDPRRAEWIREAFALIRQDIRDEEDELLPRLRTVRRPQAAPCRRGVGGRTGDRPDPAAPGRPTAAAGQRAAGRAAQCLRPPAGPGTGQRPGRPPRLAGGSGCGRGRMRGRAGGTCRAPARLKRRPGGPCRPQARLERRPGGPCRPPAGLR